MDFGLFFAVLWRSRWLVLGGAVLGLVLAVLSYGQPSFSGGKPTLKPRGTEVWQSESQLLISQAGFPYGQGANPNQTSLSNLAPVYATLANGNAVQAEIHRQVALPGKVKATESLDVAISSALPFVILTATASTREDATKLAVGAASIFQAYVTGRQASGRIPGAQRVQLSVVQSGANTKLVEGHKLSIPILVFVAVLIGAMALVFLKESARQRVAAELGGVPADADRVPVDAGHAPADVSPLQARAGEAASASDHGGEYAGTNNGGDVVIHRDPAVQQAGDRRW
jgi:hypothetical protein